MRSDFVEVSGLLRVHQPYESTAHGTQTHRTSYAGQCLCRVAYEGRVSRDSKGRIFMFAPRLSVRPAQTTALEACTT
jgi:hypothetical protein